MTTITPIQHPINKINNNVNNSNNREPWEKHAVEAGIRLGFQNATESRKYKYPIKAEYKNFALNPQFELEKLNRPFNDLCQYPINTEYSTRYRNPSTVPYDKYPWIQKF